MSGNATVTILSSNDSSILSLFPTLLSANATACMTIQVVTEISTRVISAFLASQVLPASAPVTLIPVLRAALPMYVAASPLFPNSNTALVRCFKNKATHGPDSVQVEWMGSNPTEATSLEQQHGNPPKEQQPPRLIILDTILATGATILKLCDELSSVPGSENRVTVLSCYASPQAIAAVACHSAVHSIVVAHQADTVDEHGYLVPYTNGDMGDKLFGKKMAPKN